MSEIKPPSPPSAFMPSPNDSLQSLRSSSISSLPNSGMYGISCREQVRSASRVPSTSRERLTSPIRAPSLIQDPEEEPSWRELYQKQQDAFELKEEINRRERKKLQTEVAKLESELLVERSKSKQLELALETATIIRNGSRSRDTSRDAARNSSYSSENGMRHPAESVGPASALTQAPPTMNGNHRLSSISEVVGEHTPKTLQWVDQQARGGAFAHAPHLIIGSDGNSDVSPDTNLTPRAEDSEDPRSPPTSTAMLSPPPAKNTAYAGHTPLKPEALSVSSTPGEQDTPTARNTHQNAEAPIPSDNDPIHDVDDDRALTGPLGLPTNPENAGGVIISALNEKLQDAAESPDHSKPTVLQGTISEDGDGSEAPLEGTPPSLEPEAEDTVVDAGPKLKLKRSMNFGAPIGALPGKPFLAESTEYRNP